MLQRTKTLFIAVALTACALSGAALVYSGRQGGDAENSRVPELLSALPPGEPSVVYLDLVAIRASTFYQQRQNKGPIAVPNRDYADFVQSTGFDFEKDLDRAVIASWPQAFAREQDQQGKPKLIVIADGRFDQHKIHEYALRKGKVDHQMGHEVLQFPTDTPEHWNSITFLNEHRIAIVEGPSVAVLFEHHDDPSATDPIRERAARVAGAAAFAISRVPKSPDKTQAPGQQSKSQSSDQSHDKSGDQSRGTPQDQSAQLLGLAKSLQWVTVAARPEGSNLRISLEGECLTDSDARQLQATLEVLRSLARAGLESPKTQQSMKPEAYEAAENILKTTEIAASADRVRILVELTPEVLKMEDPGKGKPTP